MGIPVLVRHLYIETGIPVLVRHLYIETGIPVLVRHLYIETGIPVLVRHIYIETGIPVLVRHLYIETGPVINRRVLCIPARVPIILLWRPHGIITMVTHTWNSSSVFKWNQINSCVYEYKFYVCSFLHTYSRDTYQHNIHLTIRGLGSVSKTLTSS